MVDSYSREMDFIKYWHGELMIKIFGHTYDSPSRPEWVQETLYTGWCARFIARRLAKRDLSFIYSLDKGSGQSWPSPTLGKLAMTFEDHKANMSRETPEMPRDLAREVRRTSREIFYDPPKATKSTPSGSACSQASVKNGGALSLFKRFQYPSRETADRIGRLRSLQEALVQHRIYIHRYAAEMLELPGCEEDWIPWIEDKLSVKIVAVPDLKKYRIISKGNGYLYTFLQPLQGQLLACWKKSPFSTMLEEDLEPRVRRMDTVGHAFPLWCSVDYKSATDKILKEPSMICFRSLNEWNAIKDTVFEDSYFSHELQEWLPSEKTSAFADVDVGALSFSYARCIYPKVVDNGEVLFESDPVDNFEGQLMGHPLSFPFLCVENLSAYRTAIRRWVHEDRRRADLGKIMWNNVIVNGDDLLCKCEESFLPHLYRTTSEMGLVLSVGKNYVSSHTCMINSQIFQRVSGVMTRRGYLNQRFIYGKGNTRVNSDNGDVTLPTNLSGNVNQMLERVPWGACTIPMIMSRFSDSFFGNNFFGHPNWFLPRHLGGIGFDKKFGDPENKITRNQRILASMFVRYPQLALWRLKGVSLPVAKYYGAVANPRMIRGEYVAEESEEFGIDDAWLARIALAERLEKGAIKEPPSRSFSRIKRDYRLKPMSDKGIDSYSTVRWLSTKLPDCPPLNSF